MLIKKRYFSGICKYPGKTMAKLNIQGISVECRTTKYLTDYEIELNFINNETKEGMVKCMKFTTGTMERKDLTFDCVETLINEKVKERNIEIEEISSIRVKEIETFKKSVYKDGENYS